MYQQKIKKYQINKKARTRALIKKKVLKFKISQYSVDLVYVNAR